MLPESIMGILKAKLLKEKYEAKLEFPGGEGGAKQKTFHEGSIDIFWNYTFKRLSRQEHFDLPPFSLHFNDGESIDV